MHHERFTLDVPCLIIVKASRCERVIQLETPLFPWYYSFPLNTRVPEIAGSERHPSPPSRLHVILPRMRLESRSSNNANVKTIGETSKALGIQQLLQVTPIDSPRALVSGSTLRCDGDNALPGHTRGFPRTKVTVHNNQEEKNCRHRTSIGGKGRAQTDRQVETSKGSGGESSSRFEESSRSRVIALERRRFAEVVHRTPRILLVVGFVRNFIEVRRYRLH